MLTDNYLRYRSILKLIVLSLFIDTAIIEYVGGTSLSYNHKYNG